MIKLLAIGAFSFGLVTGAIAQPPTPIAPAEAPSSSANLPSGWSGPISDAFFTDENGMILRTNEEIQTRWSSLSGEQQDQVRADCETMVTRDPKPDALTGTNAAPIDRICSLIKTM